MTGKQNAFVIEYLKDLNATQAAVRAGYNPKYAMSLGCQLLNNAKVKNAITEQQKAAAIAQGITQEKIVKEWSNIAFSDIAEALDENGAILNVKKMPESIRRAISSIEVVELFSGEGVERKFAGYTKKIRLWPKNDALENLGKIIGVYYEDNKQKVEANLTALAALALAIRKKEEAI